MKTNQNTDLVNLLNIYANYNDYNYKYQTKLYDRALNTFKKIQKKISNMNTIY